MDYKKIVWLASYPKSGNTWVRCFLDAYLIGEVDINELVCSVTDDRADRHQVGDGSLIQTMPLDIQQLARPMNLLRLVRAFNENKFADVPLFVKTHAPNMIANGVELLPLSLTYRTIYIVRDPRDVLPSFSKHMGTDLETGIQWMQDKYRCLKATEQKVGDLISAWDDHVNSFLNDDCHGVLYVKYEDMRADPVPQFAAMLKHAGMEPDVERIKKALDVVKLDRLKKKEAENGFIESSPYAKDQFFGDGKVTNGAKLTPMQRHRLEKAFGRVMKRLGYLEKRKYGT